MLNRFGVFVAGITACYRYIQRIKASEMTELGLKGTHVMCLFYLHQHPQGLTAAQLCQLCGEDKAAMSRSLSELEARGYLQTQLTDGKKYRAKIRLTALGIQAACKIDTLIQSWVAAGGDGLTEQERESFYVTLGQIADNLKSECKSKELL